MYRFRAIANEDVWSAANLHIPTQWQSANQVNTTHLTLHCLKGCSLHCLCPLEAPQPEILILPLDVFNCKYDIL